MAAFSISFLTWTLIVLLSLLSSALTCDISSETFVDLQEMNNTLKNCSNNCSSPNVTDRCQCLNFTSSEVKNCSVEYFTRGLRNLTSEWRDAFSRLARRITGCQIDKSRVFLECQARISPQDFHDKLKNVLQQLNSNLNSQ